MFSNFYSFSHENFDTMFQKILCVCVILTYAWQAKMPKTDPNT